MFSHIIGVKCLLTKSITILLNRFQQVKHSPSWSAFGSGWTEGSGTRSNDDTVRRYLFTDNTSFEGGKPGTDTFISSDKINTLEISVENLGHYLSSEFGEIKIPS